MNLLAGPGSLLAVALLFLLPFAEFSCKGRTVATVNGYEAAFGTKVEAELPFGDLLKERSSDRGGLRLQLEQDGRAGGNDWVMAAFLTAVIGGGVSLFIRRMGTLAGIAAVILFFVAQSDIQNQLQVESLPLLTVKFQLGFWLSIIASALGAVFCWRK